MVPRLFSYGRDKITRNEASKVYDALDVDDNGVITLNEFSLYFEGVANATFNKQLDSETENSIKNEVD